MAVVPLRTNEKVDYSVIVKDATGADARVESPKWEITGPIKILASNPPEGGLPPIEPPPVVGGGPIEPPVEPPPVDPGLHPEHPIVLPPGQNPPPVVSHPDTGIPHPQPVDEAEKARQAAKAKAATVAKPRMTGPYTCTVAALGGETGAATITFTCDADLGDGVKPLVAIGAIAVIAGEAAVVELEAGVPVPQEPPAEAKAPKAADKATVATA